MINSIKQNWRIYLKNLLFLLIGAALSQSVDIYRTLKEWRTPQFKGQLITLNPSPLFKLAGLGEFKTIRCVGGSGSKTLMAEDQIDLIYLIRITNTGPKPIQISSYQLDLHTIKGWVDTQVISLAYPYAVYTETKGWFLIWDYSQDAFDLLASRDAIQPGHSITGWVFIRIPSLTSIEILINTFSLYMELKMQIYDSQNNYSTLNLDLVGNPLAFEQEPQISEKKPQCSN